MAEKEYIEREAAMLIVKNTCGDYAAAFASIGKLPAADVASVKHGHWIYKKRTKLVSTGIAKVTEDRTAVIMKKHITVKVPYCSICGERGGDDKLDATPFCPDCGAKMDGDTDANSNDNKTPET